ncbi:MAG TPA: MFS transporter [Candidatus Methylomirabilis sp.]|nr:MFS transporter [Candidatus Methylomirabilis sp.]HSB81288.1 MFS transporter [Candidatus Methylomirabilis sp.]
MYTKPFVLAAIASFLFFSNVNAYTLLPLYIQALGGGEGQIGTIMAMYSVAAILCQASLGAFLDRWSRKPVFLAAAGTLALVSITFTFTRSLTWHFYLLRFLQGGAVAIFLTSNLTLIADLAPPSRRAEAVGIFGVSGLVSIALAPAIGEAILRVWGFQALFAATALVAVAALAVCLATTMPAAVPVPSTHGLGPSFWPTFLPILIAAFLFGLANSIVFVFLPPFARFVGLPRIGPFYVLYTGAAITVRLLGGRLADRLGRQQVILPSLVGLAIGILLFALLSSTWLLLLVALINGTSHGFLYPAASALAFDRAPSGGRGRTLAVYNIAVLLGGATGAFGFGWLVELLGYRPGFLLVGLLLATGAGVFWRKR